MWVRSSSESESCFPSTLAFQSPCRKKKVKVAKLRTAAAKYGLEYKEFDWLGPIYLPLDHFMVRDADEGLPAV